MRFEKDMQVNIDVSVQLFGSLVCSQVVKLWFLLYGRSFFFYKPIFVYIFLLGLRQERRFIFIEL
jgi:hypothetical protein